MMVGSISYIHADITGAGNYSVQLTTYLITQSIMVPLIIGANILVIITIVLVDKLHNIDNVYICGVAVADVMIGGFYLPMDIISDSPDTLHYVRGSPYVCVLYYFSYTFNDISLLLLLVMCFDRWVEAVYPYHYEEMMTNRKARNVVLSVFFFLLLYTTVLLATSFEYDEKESDLLRKCSNTYNLPDWHTQIVQPSFIIVCLVLSVIGNVSAIRANRKNSHYHAMSFEDCVILKYKKESIKISSLLTFLFIVLWAPTYYQVYRVHDKGDRDTEAWFEVITNLARVSNSFLNVFVYSYTSDIYRTLYGCILRTCPCSYCKLRPLLNERAEKFHTRKTIHWGGLSSSNVSFGAVISKPIRPIKHDSMPTTCTETTGTNSQHTAHNQSEPTTVATLTTLQKWQKTAVQGRKLSTIILKKVDDAKRRQTSAQN